MLNVKEEVNNWRDRRLSNRHRAWGWDCPATDLDFIMVEYNRNIPVAIIDYKHGNSKGSIQKICRSSSVQAQLTLANMAGIAFSVVLYWPDTWVFMTYPANDSARRVFNPGERLTELEYVKKLYSLRGIPAPAALVAALGTDKTSALSEVA